MYEARKINDISKKVNLKCDICISTIFCNDISNKLFLQRHTEFCSQLSAVRTVSLLLLSIGAKEEINLMLTCSQQIVCCLQKAESRGGLSQAFLIITPWIVQHYCVCLLDEFFIVFESEKEMRENAITLQYTQRN